MSISRSDGDQLTGSRMASASPPSRGAAEPAHASSRFGAARRSFGGKTRQRRPYVQGETNERVDV
jgi:hypothetical protein